MCKKKPKLATAMLRLVLNSWAEAEWFTSRQPLPEKLTVTVFKVVGETNTDDLSPPRTLGLARTYPYMPSPY